MTTGTARGADLWCNLHCKTSTVYLDNSWGQVRPSITRKHFVHNNTDMRFPRIGATTCSTKVRLQVPWRKIQVQFCQLENRTCTTRLYTRHLLHLALLAQSRCEIERGTAIGDTIVRGFSCHATLLRTQARRDLTCGPCSRSSHSPSCHRPSHSPSCLCLYQSLFQSPCHGHTLENPVLLPMPPCSRVTNVTGDTVPRILGALTWL